jgi:hypothetical protein
MGFKLSSDYRWYYVPEERAASLVKVYYIENIPYDVDVISKEENLDAATEANSKIGLKADDLFRKSDYLIAEMMHPLLFELEIENPEELPNDYAA